jgi:YD repeat-containing protein
MKLVTFLATALAFVAASFAPNLLADTTIYAEQSKLIRANESVTALGPDLFGDQVNLYTGTIEFVHTDVSLPGNNSLAVRAGRRFVANREWPNTAGTPKAGLFEDWDLDIPHIHGIFSGQDRSKSGWDANATDAGTRCSNYGPPPNQIADFWHGTFLYAPGDGDQEILIRDPQATLAPTDFPSPTATYRLVTKSNWAIRCIPLATGGTGEGFLAVSPDGTKYQFDQMVFRDYATLRTTRNPVSGQTVFARNEAWILPSVITDRFGNTVAYTYDTTDRWKLLSINSSDGRSITFTYESATSRRVKTVGDGTRTWTYGYTTTAANIPTLSTVTLPDLSKWEFDISPLRRHVNYGPEAPDCLEEGPLVGAVNYVGTLNHPSGASGSFTVTPTLHGRSYVDLRCRSTLGGYLLRSPVIFGVASLTKKSISGPGLPSMSWNYVWSAPNQSYVVSAASFPGNTPPISSSVCVASNTCPTTKTVTVTDPRGDVTRHIFGNRFRVNEGQLLQVDQGWNGSTALRSTKTRYRAAVSATNPAAYPQFAGISQQPRGDGEMASMYTPEDQRIITQQGADFKWEVDAGSLGFDLLARPLLVTRSSSFGSRKEKTLYEDNSAKWVLGQIKSMTESTTSKVMVVNIYNATTANLESVSHFGKVDQTMNWNADGTLWKRTDGLGQTTTFSNYKRGLAQNALYADGNAESAIVNNIGNIDSVTDPLANVTSYGYDAMGRLNAITRPTGDTVAWNGTTITFEPIAADEYGIAAGHWRQTVTTGNAKTIQYFDALWRPVLTRTYDATSVATEASTARMVRRNFEFTGRTVFESYPQRSIAAVTTAVDGTTSSYDAIGRMTLKQASSELATAPTTSYLYLASFQKQMTDPRGNSTTTSYQAFDEPSEGAPTSITAPEGVTVTIVRDVFGKASSITRADTSVSAIRRYVYDGFERLCKTIEPEVGATIQDYDAANNVSWRATSAALTSATSCDQASVAVASKTTFTYDARNRLKTSQFGDGSPLIARTYHGDGLLATVTSADSTWTYSHNKRRLLTQESLAIRAP